MKTVFIIIVMLTMCGCHTTQECKSPLLKKRLDLYRSENLKAYNRLRHVEAENALLRQMVKDGPKVYWTKVPPIKKKDVQ